MLTDVDQVGVGVNARVNAQVLGVNAQVLKSMPRCCV